MLTLRDLYLRVAAAAEGAHPTVKAGIDSVFADFEAEVKAPAVEPDPVPPAPLTIVPAVDLGDDPPKEEPSHEAREEPVDQGQEAVQTDVREEAVRDAGEEA